MFKTNARFAAILAGATALSLAAPGAAQHQHGASQQLNIVEVAASNGAFETLVAAVQAAGLAGTLSGDGPFTVFAPTDAAFAALPAGTVPTLLRHENKGALTYHVVAGRVSASDLIHLIRDDDCHARIETLAGDTLIARLNEGQVVLTDAADRQVLVTQTDIGTSNGVIHVLARVLLPG